MAPPLVKLLTDCDTENPQIRLHFYFCDAIKQSEIMVLFSFMRHEKGLSYVNY